MLLTVILIIISFPSASHFFIPGSKPSFSANPSHRSLSYYYSGLTTWILQTFYRAMLCIRGTSHGPVSVCLSAAKDLREIRPGSPPTRAPNAGGVGQNRRLSINIRLYLENGKR